MLFQIKTKRNPKSITELSNFPEEFELLYPPATKFIVTDDPYQTWCYFDREKDELYCADSEEQNYYNEYMVVPLEEVDMDYGPIATVSNEIEINKKNFWWGWLLIGIGIGVVISGLIALIVVVISGLIAQKKDKSDLEQNEKVTHLEV